MPAILKTVISRLLGRMRLALTRLPEDDDSLMKAAGIIPYPYLAQSINRYQLAFSTKPQFSLIYQVVSPYTMVPFDVLASLYDQVTYLAQNNIPGVFVECGVWKGGSMGVVAAAILDSKQPQRTLHLFDSFDDICEPDPTVDGPRALKDVKSLAGVNPEKLTGKLSPVKGIYQQFGGHGTVESCRDLLIHKLHYDASKVVFHPGWFQETLPNQSDQIEEIALLRLDSDWFESTRICLDYLYSKVVQGGIVVIDDYGAYEGCRTAVDRFLQSSGIKKYLIPASTTNSECFFFVK